MKRFIKIDYQENFSSICDTEEEVIEGCGYHPSEITFEEDRKSTRLNSSHSQQSRMPSSA